MTSPQPVAILCVDDNANVGEALRVYSERIGRYSWAGTLCRADLLSDEVAARAPSVVIVDIDMPGRDPFDAIAELAARHPHVRAVVFSGHTRVELVERAIEAGAWGYVSKNDGEDHLFTAIDRILRGEFVLSPEPASTVAG